jgi:formate C-acetyltransferase
MQTKTTCFPKTESTLAATGIGSRRRIDEAIDALRYKDVRSTTFERLVLTCEADTLVRELPQPLQLGEGLYYLLDRISLPVSPDDLILGRISEQVLDEGQELFFQERVREWEGRSIPPWMRDGGHECFAWDRLLHLGLSGLEDLARQELERRKADGAPDAQLDFLRGTVRVYQAFRHYARRYAEAAREAGLHEASACCADLAEQPPETFAHALQLIWLVGLVYCTMLAQNPTLTFGRLDELLLPFYRKDLADGRLTRSRAGDLIEDFYCKNNLILGRGEHQMSGGSDRATGWARNLTYDAPQYVVLGGQRADGSVPANELTALFLERIVPRFENPVVVLRYSPDLPGPVWRLACAKMRENASMMVYNDQDIIPAMVRCGIEPEDALTYTMHGCNWPDIPGCQRTVQTSFLVLPQLLLDALHATDDNAVNIDKVYARFGALAAREIQVQTDRLRAARSTWDERSPGLLRVDDCFLDGPIERARSWQLGGVRYNTVVLSIAGVASAADCLAALDEFVFRSGQVPLSDLKRALENNYAGHEALRQRCLNAPKFGQDDDRADRHAVRMLDIVLDEIDRACRLGAEGEVFAFRCLETDMRHIRLGHDVGATPDGRLAGQPISENTSPTPGAGRNGLTAMFRSLAKLPLDGINSGALNVRLQPRLFANEAGLTRLTDLLRTYLDLGGLQVQLSFADVEELRDAQRHPERHRDLMVRITGYSAAFVDMTRQAQDEIIRREEMGAN